MPNKRKPEVVFDSVILVSAFLAETGEGLAAKLFSLCVTEEILYTAEEILQEVRRVLLRKEHIRSKYSYHDAQVERFIELVREGSTVIGSLPVLHVIERDPKDDMIIACAVAAGANYIVSRDLDLLDLKTYEGIQIVRPEEFIHYLRDMG